MTKEQAIEALKEHKRQIDKKYINTRNSKAIETVLSMLEEQEYKIKQLGKGQQALIQNIGKMAFDYSDKIEQQEKIIDLMAETINNHDIDEDICKQMGQKEDCNEFEDKEKCKDCIKQYFENKAKEVK